jgi:hypothetical protein
LAFGEIPKQLNTSKETALNEVFVKELNNMDESSKEVLEKVLNYMEKKYNALTIKTAKRFSGRRTLSSFLLLSKVLDFSRTHKKIAYLVAPNFIL